MMAITIIVFGAAMNNGFSRMIMYTPAVTIVAAWINADTGVGPAIASGNSGCIYDRSIKPIVLGGSKYVNDYINDWCANGFVGSYNRCYAI
jgi:ABC-type polysaccharide/polyol phosphate export permease